MVVAMYPRQRDVMSTLPVYKAGKRAAAGGVKLSSNENPYPPLPSVLEVIAQAANQINRYPDPGSAALVQAIADRHVEHQRGKTGLKCEGRGDHAQADRAAVRGQQESEGKDEHHPEKT